jgi:hypothetical protein
MRRGRGCKARGGRGAAARAPGWLLPPRPELARRRPGRALGSARRPLPPTPSLSCGGGGGGGGGGAGGGGGGGGGEAAGTAASGERAGRGGLRQFSPEGAGTARSLGPAGPARLGALGTRAGAGRTPGCGARAGRASPHCSAAAVGSREQSPQLCTELGGHRAGPRCVQHRRAGGARGSCGALPAPRPGDPADQRAWQRRQKQGHRGARARPGGGRGRGGGGASRAAEGALPGARGSSGRPFTARSVPSNPVGPSFAYLPIMDGKRVQALRAPFLSLLLWREWNKASVPGAATPRYQHTPHQATCSAAKSHTWQLGSRRLHERKVTSAPLATNLGLSCPSGVVRLPAYSFPIPWDAALLPHAAKEGVGKQYLRRRGY